MVESSQRVFPVEWKFGRIENGGRRGEIKNKENDDRNGDVTWKRWKQVAVKLKRMNSETWKVETERWIGIKTG